MCNNLTIITNETSACIASYFQDQCDACTTVLLVTGVVTAVLTALLVAVIYVAIHITLYQCVYKPRLRSLNTTNQRVEQSSDNAVVYDAIDGTVMQMKDNEAYGTRVAIL